MIGVSVLNLGYLVIEYEVDVLIVIVLVEINYVLIFLFDVILVIKFIIFISNVFCVKEIFMFVMKDENI